MSLSFANSALLWGTLLFSVPLIIHLLNRRRYKVVRWAAQEFLLLAYQRTRRRLTLESLLLLLARCLLIVLLAIALAQPFVPGGNVLSGLGRAPRHVVLVVDTSYSMAREERPGESPMSRAMAQAKQVLESLSEDRGDEAALVTLADPPMMVQHRTSNLKQVRDAVDRLQPDFGGADLLRTLDFVNENILAPSERSHEVYLFSDLQRSTFHPTGSGTQADAGTPAAAPAAPLAGVGEALPASAWRRALTDSTQFVVVDVGDSTPSRNMTVESIEVSPSNVVRGEVVAISATVRNHSNQAGRGVVGHFVVNGRRADSDRVTFDVGAGSVASVEISSRFEEAGSATVEFALEGDELIVDDTRYLAFPVNDGVRVLLVDGQYHPDEDLRSTGRLGVMLDPSPVDPEVVPVASIFRPEVIDERRFNLRGVDLADYQLIVLSNVSRIDPEVAKNLGDAVRAGRGLWIFLGDLTDPRAYNELLHRADGTGLLPGRLLDAVGDETVENSGFRVISRDFDHPTLRVFSVPQLQPQITEIPRIKRFYRVDVTPKDTATSTILSVNAAEPQPLMVEKTAGRGRVILFTTSADKTWSTMSEHVYMWLPFVQEIASYLTLPDLTASNLAVRDRIRRSTRTIPQRVAIVTPDGARRPITDAATEREFGEWVLPPFDDTRRPGFYNLELSYPISGAGSDAGREVIEHYAVNVDPSEGDLARVEPAAFPELYPGVDVTFAQEVEVVGAAVGDRREGELWRSLLWAVVALLVAEMTLAWWFGRK